MKPFVLIDAGGATGKPLKLTVPRSKKLVSLFTVQFCASANSLPKHEPDVAGPRSEFTNRDRCGFWKDGKRPCTGAHDSADPFMNSHVQKLADLSLKHRLPAIYGFREFADAGGLLS